MKKTLAAILLGLEGILILAMEIMGTKIPGAFTSVMAFPYEQIGLGLRKMSLSGKIGNIWAIVIFAAAALLPAIYWLIFRLRKGFKWIDVLLPIFSAGLLGGIYVMINPGYLPVGVEMERAVIGCALHSVWTGYAILRLAESLKNGRRDRLARVLKGLLWVLAAAFVYIVAGSCANELISALKELAAKNTMPGISLTMTQVFLVLGYINSALPYVLDIPVIFAGQGLLRELSKDEYGEGAAMMAEKLAARCGFALCGTVVSGVIFNILQLIFAKGLLKMDTAVQIPLVSVIFALAALMAAGYIRAGRRIKQDNDLFI